MGFSDELQALQAKYGESGMGDGGSSLFQGQNVVGTPASQIAGSGGAGFMGNFFDKVDPKTGMINQGWGSFGLGALQAGAGLFLGNKQLGLAEDQFAESKRQFGKNFGAQVQNYNTNLADRQDRRYTGAGGDTVASNPYESTTPYMDKNRMVG